MSGAALFPVEGLRSVTVVVPSARAAAEAFARVHGVAEWRVRRYEPGSVADATTRGFRAEHAYVAAEGTAATPGGDVPFTLVEPLGGWTTYHEFLITRGAGIHSLRVAALDAPALRELRAALAAANVPVAQSSRPQGTGERVLFDTRAELGGFYLEVETTDAEDAGGADEVWDLRSAIPAGGPVVPLRGLAHFGVVVPELMPAVERYARLFGIADFAFRNWRTAPGSLDDPTYLGKPVDHAYFTTMANAGPGVAFEVIQPTLGPSHYREDFMQRLGPGIHHIHGGNVEDRAAWPALQARAASAEIPTVMSGSILERFLDFYYLDTRAVAGYVTELVVPGANYARGRPDVPFAMTAHFGARA